MDKDYKKLILIEVNDKAEKGKAAQSNKFYEMIWDGGSDFTVKYGRVESSSTTITYPYSQWHKKYNEKLKKGYKDVTEFVTVAVTTTGKSTSYDRISDNSVQEFMELMKKYRDNLVSTTYSVKSEAVSQKQIDTAQTIIDGLNALSRTVDKNRGMVKAEKESANFLLTELYTTIPRKMKNVKDHLIPSIDLDKILVQEQDNLDAMASQVVQNKPKTTKGKDLGTILDALGLTMSECKSNKEIQYLIDQVGKSYTKEKVEKIFRVDKKNESESFDNWVVKQKDKKTRILIHGTRCSSVIPILDIGLKIRPPGNCSFSGKAYGEGNYFSETVSKSLNYTGWQTDKILLVYEVHTGNPFVYDGWYKGNSFTLNYKELSKRGYDSTFVKAGNGLLNSEIIAYNENQNRIKYIIWLK